MNRWDRRLRLTLVLASGLLGVFAVTAAVVGGVRLELGPIVVSIGSPFRPLAQGCALLLLREALGDGSSRASRLRTLGLFTTLIFALSLESKPRVVGDGHEYVAMAWNISEGRPPALTREEIQQVKAFLPPRMEGYPFALLKSPDPEGRQSLYHSWAYSLFAAPFVRVMSLTGMPLLSAFTVANGLLLLVAVVFLQAREGPRVTLLIFGGAALWWVDKPHPELFLTSVLVTAIVALPRRPGLSLVLQGIAGLQYPVFGVGLLASAAWLASRGRLREAGSRAGLVAGLLLILAVPLSNIWWSVQAVPLSTTVVPHLPGLAALTAVLVDPNLGLAFAWPALAIATLLGLAVAMKTRGVRADTVILLTLVAALLLFVVALPRNLNHGGTRGVSRYALWLVPLCVPALLSLERAGRRYRAVLLALAAGSLVTALGDYHPRMKERYVTPSFVAGWLWRHWPGVDNPLPEVFAERTAGAERQDALPAATEGCEKALVVGDGTPRALWPLWCRPQELPSECRPIGTFCYANKRGAEYAFVRAPRQPGFEEYRPQAWYWTGSPNDGLVRFLSQFTRSTIWGADPGRLDELFAGKRRLGPKRARINRESTIVWLTAPRRRAWVAPKPGPGQRTILIDPRRAQVLKNVAVDPAVPTRVAIPEIAPLLLVVAPEALLPPDLAPG
jgi:hypothetical protein